MGRLTDAPACWFTDPWSLADCAKSVSGPLALHASTRDEPVHLSDSPPETHQHCSPADATKPFISKLSLWSGSGRVRACARTTAKLDHKTLEQLRLRAVRQIE